MCGNGKLSYFNAFGSLNQKLGLTATQSRCHKERETGIWEVGPLDRDRMPYAQDYFSYRDFVGMMYFLILSFT